MEDLLTMANSHEIVHEIHKRIARARVCVCARARINRTYLISYSRNSIYLYNNTIIAKLLSINKSFHITCNMKN